MRWESNVDVIYCPIQVDGRHWVGVVIDIAHWCIHVLDCNSACISDAKLDDLLQPILALLPPLIRHNGGKALEETAMNFPMPVTRLDIPHMCKQIGMSTLFYTCL